MPAADALSELPDALADALGSVVADFHREWAKDLDRIGAESRATIAELRAEVLSLKVELKTNAEQESARIAAVLANVKDGVDGVPGEKGEAGEAGPTGPAGPAGERGEKGPEGQPGSDGKDADEDAVVAKVMASLVIPQGERGEPGPKGDPGERGEQGLVGKDGASVIGMVIDRDGRFIATLSDGATRDLGVVVGKDGAPGLNGVDGAPGAPGRDGISFDGLDVEQIDERSFAIHAVSGTDKREIGRAVFPIVLDRGVYKSGETYRRGDSVSFGGSLFIAQEDTTEQPELSKSWRLAIKRGRDGKNGKNGERGIPGPKGEDGRNLTQILPDGTRY